MSQLSRRVVAEAIGTAFLLVAIVGSGIMGERLDGGNIGIALLANSIATGGALLCLIAALGPISGAHFNPAVSLADAMRGGLPWRELPLYIGAQILGAISGVAAANVMFGLPAIVLSHRVRTGPATGVLGVPRDVRPALRYLGMRSIPQRYHSVRGGRVYHRCVLVHVVNVVRKPRRYHRPLAVRHLCGHPTSGRPRFRGRSTPWRDKRNAALCPPRVYPEAGRARGDRSTRDAVAIAIAASQLASQLADIAAAVCGNGYCLS